MQMVMSLSILVILLLLVCGYSSAQGTGGCNPDPPDTLVSGVGTLPNGVPSISTNTAGKYVLSSKICIRHKIMCISPTITGWWSPC